MKKIVFALGLILGVANSSFSMGLWSTTSGGGSTDITPLVVNGTGVGVGGSAPTDVDLRITQTAGTDRGFQITNTGYGTTLTDGFVARIGSDNNFYITTYESASTIFKQNAASNSYFTVEADGDVLLGGRVLDAYQGFSIADNGGGTAAAGTLTPTKSLIEMVCNDGNGCDVTMSESGAAQGMHAYLINNGANTMNMADSSGVSELAGAFAMGQYDTLHLVYQGDRWYEIGRSNN